MEALGDSPQRQQIGGKDTSQTELLRNMVSSYPVVFLAKEVKYWTKMLWGSVGVYHWDTKSLRRLLVEGQHYLEPRGPGGFWCQNLAFLRLWDACCWLTLLISWKAFYSVICVPNFSTQWWWAVLCTGFLLDLRDLPHCSELAWKPFSFFLHTSATQVQLCHRKEPSRIRK